MKLTNTLLALGLAALPASARAMDDDDAAALVQKLGDKEYKVRRDAYRQLEKLGSSARSALETAAKSDDPEVRWNASRLLDRLDAQSHGLKERDGSSSGPPDEQDGQDDTPRARRGNLPRDIEQQLRELEQRMRDFEKEFDRDGSGPFRFGGPNGLQGFDHFPRFSWGFGERLGDGGELDLTPGSSFSRSSTVNGKTESFSLKVDEDGHVTAEEQKDGKTTKVESDSIEAFKKEHPEMLRRGPLTIAIRPHAQGGMPGDMPGNMNGQGDRPRVAIVRPDADAATPAPKKKNKVKAPKPETPDQAKAHEKADKVDVAPEQKPRLGVELAPVASEVADYLGLEGEAFQVVRVMDDMPAAKKGLKPRDILLEVNGKPIHSFDDVLKALDGADPNTVKVVVLRRGQRKEL